jgi:hypothetical protein
VIAEVLLPHLLTASLRHSISLLDEIVGKNCFFGEKNEDLHQRGLLVRNLNQRFLGLTW